MDGRLDQAVERAKDLAGEKLVSGAVDGQAEVDTVGEGLDAEGSRGTERQTLLDGLSLELQLGEGTVVGTGIGLVLLHELLCGVVDQGLVELSTTELVVVGSSQHGVHATARGNDGNVGAGTTNVGDNDVLVFGRVLVELGIVGKESSDGLGDELEDLEASVGGSLVQGILLGIGEV